MTVPLSFDEQPFLPVDVPVHTGSGSAGQPAGGLMELISAPSPPVGVDPVEMVADLLRRCVREAADLLGQPVARVRVTVPPSWGPRRRGPLRVAVERAGFAEVQLVNAAVASAVFATRRVGLHVPVDGFLMTCDVGSGAVTATVLHRRGAQEWDVWSTIDRAATVVADHDRSALTADVVRTVKEAIEAADIEPSSLATVVIVGDDAVRPGLDTAITAEVGIDATVLPRPAQAAVLGCAIGDPTTVEAGRWTPVSAADTRLSQIVVVALAGVASMLLLWHTIASAYIDRIDQVIDYVLINRGELALACALAMVTSLTWGRFLVLIRVEMLTERPSLRAGPQRLLAASIGIGVMVAVIYAMVAAVGVSQSASGFLRVAIWTVLPPAACAGWATLLLPRLSYLGGGALRQYASAVVPIVLITVGAAAVQYAYNTPLSPGTVRVVAHCGAAVAAAGCVWLLTHQFLARLIAVPLVAAVGALAVDVHTTGLYGYAYVACLDIWWLIATASITLDAYPQLRTLTWTRARRTVPAHDPMVTRQPPPSPVVASEPPPVPTDPPADRE